MELTDEKKDSLQHHYEIWGVDEVRKELERSERDKFAEPEVTEFAREWVEAQDERMLRQERSRQLVLLVLGFVCLGLVLGLVL